MQPRGCSSAAVFIGFGGKIPNGVQIADDMFVMHFDKNVPNLYNREYYCQVEWQDFLRLETTGPNSQDHPYVKLLRTLPVAWYGNSKLFKTTIDLMIAASQYTDGDTFELHTRVPISDQEPTAHSIDMGYDDPNIYSTVLKLNTPGFHPLAGPLPIGVKYEETNAILEVMLEVLWYASEFQHSGHFTMKPMIYRNLYSVFSVHTRSMILAISYWQIYMNGDGTVQEKFDMYGQYRRTLAYRLQDLVNKWMELTNTTNIVDCATALHSYFNVVQSA
jgi:hypothetical protein